MAQIPSSDLPVVNPNTGRINLEWYAALQRIVSEIGALGSGGVTSFEGRTGVVVSANGDYTASEITNAPAGNISALTVQAAIDELDTEKQPADADLTALAGLSGTGIVVRTAANTYAERTTAAPAAGLTITNPAGIAGNITFAFANDLGAIEALGSTGFAVRTAADTWAQRSLTQPAAGITISNSDGVSGNPTFALANDLSALEAMSGTGLVARTASETYAQRTLTAPAAGITITNPAGIAGNPTLALADDLAALEGLGSTGIAVRSAANTWVQRSVAAGTGIGVSNGDGVAGNPTVSLSFLGIQNLADPGADRIYFWDDSAGFTDWLIVGSGLTISDKTLSATGGSGLILQVLQTTNTANTDLSTTIPQDDTTPTSTEGTSILSQAITPASTSSRILCEVALFGVADDESLIVALFRGTTCIDVKVGFGAFVDRPTQISMSYIDSPATTSSTTYSVRVGASAGTARINGTSTSRLFGGAAKATLILTELAS